MSGEEFLLEMAHVGLVLGGLVSLITIFREKEVLVPQDHQGITLILEHSFAASFFSLLPLALFYSLESEETSWRLSSAIFALFYLYVFMIQKYRIRRLSTAGTPPRHPTALNYVFLPITVLFVFIEATNAVFLGSLTGYIWGLLWLLLACLFQFFHFVF